MSISVITSPTFIVYTHLSQGLQPRFVRSDFFVTLAEGLYEGGWNHRWLRAVVTADLAGWGDNPFHTLIRLHAGKGLGYTAVKSDPYTEGRRGWEEAVVVTTPEPEPPPRRVESHPRDEDHIKLRRVHYREVGHRLPHAHTMADEATWVIGMHNQAVSLHTRECPPNYREKAKESPQVQLVPKGQVGHDSLGPPYWVPLGQTAAEKCAGRYDLLGRKGFPQQAKSPP